MKVFISWSGERSRAIAKAFNDWLPLVVQAVEPFFSPEIEKGSKGVDEINKNLAGSNFGLLCITPENLKSEWIHYEAGALSKISDIARVWPFLCDLKPREVVAPLSQFQNTVSNKSDILALVQSINKSSETPIKNDVLAKVFEKFWPDLEQAITKASKIKATDVGMKIDKAHHRPEEDVLDEILLILRSQQSEATRNAGKTATNIFIEDRIDAVGEATLTFASTSSAIGARDEILSYLAHFGPASKLSPSGDEDNTEAILSIKWKEPVPIEKFEDQMDRLNKLKYKFRMRIDHGTIGFV